MATGTTSITRTPGATTAVDAWTFSVWLKRCSINVSHDICSGRNNTDGGNNQSTFSFDSGDNLYFDVYSGGSIVVKFISRREFRDINAWYHIVLDFDSSTAGARSAADRMKVWVNGVRETEFSTEVQSGADEETNFCQQNDCPLVIGGNAGGSRTASYDGVMSHINYVAGVGHPASVFGEFDATDGIWKIKTSPSVTYGTNGFNLKMENRTNLDLDSSPNTYTFVTSGNLIATYDSPSNNFASMSNQWYIPTHPINLKYINNEFTATGNTSVVWTTSTLGAVGGKYYAEFEIDKNDGHTILGISQFGQFMSQAFADNTAPCAFDNSVGYLVYDGQMVIGPSSSKSAYGNALADAEILGMAWDLDNKRIYFSINGVWQNSADPSAGSGYFDYSALTGGGQWGVLIGDESGSYNDEWMTNWGNGYFGITAVTSANADAAGYGAFEYPVPTGFYALCTKNIYTYGG